MKIDFTKKENIPNLLTLGRIVMIPLFILILCFWKSSTGHVVAAIVFALASITDYLDGYLARKWKVVTNFGKFADPLADKMLVMTAFIMLVELKMVPAWIAAIIICRELAVTGLRLLLVENGWNSLSSCYAWKNQNIYTNVFNYFLTMPPFNHWYTLALCSIDFYCLFRI